MGKEVGADDWRPDVSPKALVACRAGKAGPRKFTMQKRARELTDTVCAGKGLLATRV